jgi:LysM repeat protein
MDHRQHDHVDEPRRADRPLASSRARLTPRGRAVAIAVFLVLAFLLVSLSSALHSATQAGTGAASSGTRYVTVQPGQTLWQIALRVAPRDDPRDTVDRIRSLNDLATTTVLPGQRIVVPA